MDKTKINRNPVKNAGTLMHEVSTRSIIYGILGYLPAEPCATLVVDGEFSHEVSQNIESAGFAVTRLCDPQEEIIGCVPESFSDMPERSYGVVVSAGWLGGENEFEQTARTAFEKLREGGLFIASVPGRIACALDLVSKSTNSAVSILDENVGQGGAWEDAKELFTPLGIVSTLEAIGFNVIDLFGWQMALERFPTDYLLKEDWSEDEVHDLLAVEYRLSQDRNLLGSAPTIQFVARRPNPEEEINKNIEEEIENL